MQGDMSGRKLVEMRMEGDRLVLEREFQHRKYT
jgi:hypothetical protein